MNLYGDEILYAFLEYCVFHQIAFIEVNIYIFSSFKKKQMFMCLKSSDDGRWVWRNSTHTICLNISNWFYYCIRSFNNTQQNIHQQYYLQTVFPSTFVIFNWCFSLMLIMLIRIEYWSSSGSSTLCRWQQIKDEFR